MEISQIVKAIDLAIESHAEQKDKFGRTYLYHLSQVASMTRNDDEYVVAWLHDFIEDSNVYPAEEGMKILQEIFPEEVSDAIYKLAQRPEVSREDYIAELTKNPLAAKVKYYDIRSNCDIARLKLLPKDTAIKLLEKYRRDVTQLIEAGILKPGQIKFLDRAELVFKEGKPS